MKKLLLVLVLLTFTAQNFAQDAVKMEEEKPWAIGMIGRSATIPFKTTGDDVVATLIPMFFYEGNYFYMRGIEGGVKFYSTKDWEFRALGRLRFFDAPKEVQNLLQGDAVDWGFQAKYKFGKHAYTNIELLTTFDGHFSSNVRVGREDSWGDFALDYFVEAKLKTKKFNTTYYGLNLIDVNGGIDLSAGLIFDYHVLSNLYFYGAARVTLHDRNVRNINSISFEGQEIVSGMRPVKGEVFFGVGFSNDRSKPRKKELENKPFIRLSQGFATPSALAQIIRLNSVPDTNNNKMTSLFYGHPLTDRLFTLPIHIYLTAGMVYHWPSDVQRNAQEVVIGVKFFYTIPIPWRVRLGFAEGLSYVNRVPYVEYNSLVSKGYEPSHLMNYLDFSIDINIGDIFASKSLKPLWIGYSIHHRSSIFETAQQFGRISGGSNFNTIHAQWELW